MNLCKRIAFCFLLIGINGYSQLEVAEIFSDNMVLQRNAPIQIWGWSEPEDIIRVGFNERFIEVKTDSSGAWAARFDALEAGGGTYTLTVRNSRDNLVFNNILIGDVWLCSGQSNMEWEVARSDGFLLEKEGIINSDIRHFKVERSYSYKPEEDLLGGNWQRAHANTIGAFTAVGYYFAKELNQVEKIPIGILNSSWGGSRIESWMSAESLEMENAEWTLKEREMELSKQYTDDLKIIRKRFSRLEEVENLSVDSSKNFINKVAEKNWDKIKTLEVWEKLGYGQLDGIVWFKNEFFLTQKEKKAGIKLNLGKIDDSDVTFINGQPIATTINAYDDFRNYQIPSENLKVGKNTVFVKVYDLGGHGGMYGNPEDFNIECYNGSKKFSKNWQITFEKVKRPDFSRSMNQVPTVLYNKMIHPILRFPIKGIVWYQGESNTNTSIDAFKYRDLFTTMISQWRNNFNLGDLPFLYVQLANFGAAVDEPQESNWAILRESQSEALKLSNTAQAVIIDIGESDNIHPRNKKEVGKRLALAALEKAYGYETIYSGPEFKSYSLKGNKVSLEFNHIGTGLMLNKGHHPEEFEVAGSDKKFKSAKARIENNKITVWHNSIIEPKFIRFAWGDNPDKFNLYNKEGLPAVPFEIEIK